MEQQQHQKQTTQKRQLIPPHSVNDSSRLWYRPSISRDEAINFLKNKPPGSFLIRDSNTFKGGYGLAIKVAQLPADVQLKPDADLEVELVRHFLIESTAGGVRLKGSANEPVFASLVAFVYQHSMAQRALPCLLVLPPLDELPAKMNGSNNSLDQIDGSSDISSSPKNKSLLDIGAACNLIYIGTHDCESLSGTRALSQAVTMLLRQAQPESRSTDVHFKVTSSGITLTDTARRLFFRRHYPPSSVLHCSLDPQNRKFIRSNVTGDDRLRYQRDIFGFIARRHSGAAPADNQCHVFAELDPEQPAIAVVDFINSHLLSLP